MPQISADLQRVLDRKAQEAAAKQKEGAAAPSPVIASASGPPADEPTPPSPEGAAGTVERAPPDPRLLPPFPKVTVEFDPHGLKVQMEHWHRLTQRMIQQAMMPLIRELLRLRNEESRRIKRGE